MTSLRWIRAVRTVSAREANQSFSMLLAPAEAGEEVAITKRGHVVARLVPAGHHADAPDRAAVLAAFKAVLERKMDIGGPFTRDEIHER